MAVVDKYYIDGGIPGGVKAILSHRVLLRLAGAFTTLYVPIFLYLKTGRDIVTILLFFGILSLIYALLLPFTRYVLKFFSLRAAMTVAMVLNALYYLIFIFFDSNLTALFVLAGAFLVAFRMFYWIPYHVEVAEITEKKKRGRLVAIIQSGIQMIDIFLPVVGAAVITRLSYNWLFVFAVLIIFTSISPLWKLPKIKEKFEFSYNETWKELVNKKNRKMVRSYFADGAQNFVGVCIWPIFIYEVLDGNLLDVGLLSAGVVLVTVVLRLFIGKYVDQKKSGKIFKVGKWMFISGWVFKALIQSATAIFLAGAYHSFSNVLMRVSYDAKMYDTAADQGHYVDEYTVLREISINIARVFTMIVIIVLLQFFSLFIAFIFAAVISMLLALDLGYSSDKVQGRVQK